MLGLEAKEFRVEHGHPGIRQTQQGLPQERAVAQDVVRRDAHARRGRQPDADGPEARGRRHGDQLGRRRLQHGLVRQGQRPASRAGHAPSDRRSLSRTAPDLVATGHILTQRREAGHEHPEGRPDRGAAFRARGPSSPHRSLSNSTRRTTRSLIRHRRRRRPGWMGSSRPPSSASTRGTHEDGRRGFESRSTAYFSRDRHRPQTRRVKHQRNQFGGPNGIRTRVSVTLAPSRSAGPPTGRRARARSASAARLHPP